MQGYLISLVVKRLLREGVKQIGDPEQLRLKAIHWIRAEIGGWGEKLKEEAAIAVLNAAWAIIFEEVAKYLDEVGFDFLADNTVSDFSARSECTLRVCERLGLAA